MCHIDGEQPDRDNVRYRRLTRDSGILGNGKPVLSSALLLAGSAAESMEAGSESVDTAVGRGNVIVLHLSISVSGRRQALHCLPVSCNDRNMIDYMYYNPILWFAVQPVTVYLAITLFRRLKKR